MFLLFFWSLSIKFSFALKSNEGCLLVASLYRPNYCTLVRNGLLLSGFRFFDEVSEDLLNMKTFANDGMSLG